MESSFLAVVKIHIAFAEIHVRRSGSLGNMDYSPPYHAPAPCDLAVACRIARKSSEPPPEVHMHQTLHCVLLLLAYLRSVQGALKIYTIVTFSLPQYL
jgi:hypothetical protein